MKTQWNLSLFPAIENPQMIEFIENVNINSQDYLSLLGKIQQWAMKYKLQTSKSQTIFRNTRTNMRYSRKLLFTYVTNRTFML